MDKAQNEEIKEQVFRLCHKLTKMIPPIDLKSAKADETLRFWLPEISWEDINLYKKEFMTNANSNHTINKASNPF